MKTTLAAAAAAAVLLLSACGAAGTKPGTAAVTGTAMYREFIMLPESAVLTVQLADVSLADAPSKTIAEQKIRPVRVPAAFTLTYDPATIDPRHTYAVSASIRDETGRLLFVTDTRHTVLTQGAGSTVDIVMVGAGR